MFTLIAAILSGVLATIITVRLTIWKEHVFFLRQRIEELYLAVERYHRDASGHFIRYIGLLKNELSYNQLFDMQIADAKDASITGDAHGKMSMLTHLYFANLIPALERYDAARGGINKILMDHKRAYKEGDIDGSDWLLPFNKALAQFEQAGSAFMLAVIDKAREFSAVEALSPKFLNPHAWVSAIRARIT